MMSATGHTFDSDKNTKTKELYIIRTILNRLKLEIIIIIMHTIYIKWQNTVQQLQYPDNDECVTYVLQN